jgi:hypothetical protein
MDQTPARIGPKDVFAHLLGIVTLYASAISFTVLVFQYINLRFPGVAQDSSYYLDSIQRSIRFAVSTLIVVFPVYFLTSRMLRKMYEAEPGRISLGIRKWLSYFTLFLAAAIAIGYLVSVINTFLEGDFTAAFLLKALTVFFVTGSIAFYYRAITKGEEARPAVRYYAYVVAVVVAAAMVAAFFMVGSPARRRLEKVDVERLNDLQNIQYQIGSFYQTKSRLPAALSELNDGFRGVSIPKDPQTGSDFVYETTGPESFKLCAEFNLASSKSSGTSNVDIAVPSGPAYYGPYGSNWEHTQGLSCFFRTIDKDFFKQLTK